MLLAKIKRPEAATTILEVSQFEDSGSIALRNIPGGRSLNDSRVCMWKDTTLATPVSFG